MHSILFSSYFLNDLINFNQIFSKNITYDIIKGLQNYTLVIIHCGHYFVQYGFMKSAFSTYSLGKRVCSRFSMLSL